MDNSEKDRASQGVVAGVDVLDGASCWHLLRSVATGRLAVVDEGGRPDVFPVNHVVDRGSVVFRTADGGKLRAATADRDVVFEVDGVIDDPTSGRTAWSVVLRGQAFQITALEELLETGSLTLAPWQAGKKGRFVRVRGEVTGRAFHVTGSGWWRTPTAVALSPAPDEEFGDDRVRARP